MRLTVKHFGTCCIGFLKPCHKKEAKTVKKTGIKFYSVFLERKEDSWGINFTERKTGSTFLVLWARGGIFLKKCKKRFLILFNTEKQAAN